MVEQQQPPVAFRARQAVRATVAWRRPNERIISKGTGKNHLPQTTASRSSRLLQLALCGALVDARRGGASFTTRANRGIECAPKVGLGLWG